MKQEASSQKTSRVQDRASGAGPDGLAIAAPDRRLDNTRRDLMVPEVPVAAYMPLGPEQGRIKPFMRHRQLPGHSFPVAQRVIQRKEGDVHSGVVAKKTGTQTLAIRVGGATESWFEIPASQTLTEGQLVEFTEGASLAVTNLRVVTPTPAVTVTPTVTPSVSASPVAKSGSAGAPTGGSADEVKSSGDARKFGVEMGALGKPSAGGRYQYHYGVNLQHPDSKMPHRELGIRAEAMSKHGGTVGEFSFKPAKYLKSGGIDDQMVAFNMFFNMSVIASDKHQADYAGAFENKQSGKATKYFDSPSANKLAPVAMGRRFSKASMVYAVMGGGHIHFHLEGLGDPSAVAEIVGKKGTYKDAVTSSELRYVRRHWDRGFSVFLPEGFWQQGDGSDDEGSGEPKMVEDKSFKGFKDHTSFYRKASDKIVTVPPPW